MLLDRSLDRGTPPEDDRQKEFLFSVDIIIYWVAMRTEYYDLVLFIWVFIRMESHRIRHLHLHAVDFKAIRILLRHLYCHWPVIKHLIPRSYNSGYHGDKQDLLGAPVFASDYLEVNFTLRLSFFSVLVSLIGGIIKFWRLHPSILQ